MNRRSFMIRVGGALLAVPAVLQLTACGDDGGGDGPDAAMATSFTVEGTGSGHTHQITVMCSDLSSSGDVTYTSTSTGGHTHQVTIQAISLGLIANGSRVTVTTDDAGHEHTWVISKPSSTC